MQSVPNPTTPPPAPANASATYDGARIIRHIATLYGEGALVADAAMRVICRELGIAPPLLKPTIPAPDLARYAAEASPVALQMAAEAAPAKLAPPQASAPPTRPRPVRLTTQMVNEARLAKGLTLAAIRAHSGLSGGTLTKIAANGSVSADTLRRLMRTIEAL